MNSSSPISGWKIGKNQAQYASIIMLISMYNLTIMQFP